MVNTKLFLLALIAICTSLSNILSLSNSRRCMRTGCSNELCSDRNQISPCIYKKEYKCLDFAICKRNSSGFCAWDKSALDYHNCMSNV